MKLVDGKGNLQCLNEGDGLLAGQTSLGTLGVAVEFTILVQEMSYCRVQNTFDMDMKVRCIFECNKNILYDRSFNAGSLQV